MILSMIPAMESQVGAYADAKPLPTLTGNQAQDVANIALSQLGYAEDKKGGTYFGAWWSGVVKNGYNYTNAGWCAMFACWCANQAGAGMNVAYDNTSAQVEKLLQWLKKNGRVVTDFSSKPQAGDFIFFGNGGSADHVAVVVDYDSDTNQVTFVGGNQSDKVKKTSTNWSKSGKYGSQKVLGYGRPNYGRVKPTAAPKVKTDKNVYHIGNDVVISWGSVSGSTGYSLTVVRDGEVIKQKEMGKKTSYTLTNVSDGKYTVKVTSSNGFVPSEAGTCKFTVANIKPSIRLWLSDSKNGSAVESYMAGAVYYLCYELVDEQTGRRMDSISDSNYSVKLSVTAADGEKALSTKHTKDADCDSFFFKLAGEYTLTAEVKGDFKTSCTLTVTAEENPRFIHATQDSVLLTLEGTANTAIVPVWTSGTAEKNVLLWQRDNTNVTCEFGTEGADGRTPLILTANAAGTTTITLATKTEGSDVILDMITLVVTVDAKAHSVTYDANGGEDAPAAQVKLPDTNLILHTDKPERDGYIFLGWATTPDATMAEYQPGTVLTAEGHYTLYAVWSKTFLTGDANVDGTVNVKDWNCLYEHGNNELMISGGAMQPADVNGDGEVNLKDWTRLFEHVSEVNPLW